MYEEYSASVQMVQMILQNGFFDEKSHSCKVLAYDPEVEDIYLLSEEMELPGFSLDGIYECRVEAAEGPLICLGDIRERYWNKLGRVVKFHIKNGFYKNTVN